MVSPACLCHTITFRVTRADTALGAITVSHTPMRLSTLPCQPAHLCLRYSWHRLRHSTSPYAASVCMFFFPNRACPSLPSNLPRVFQAFRVFLTQVLLQTLRQYSGKHPGCFCFCYYGLIQSTGCGCGEKGAQMSNANNNLKALISKNINTPLPHTGDKSKCASEGKSGQNLTVNTETAVV